VVVGIICINPHSKDDINYDKRAKFEFENYKYFNITSAGINEYLTAKQGFHYNNYDRIMQLSYIKQDANTTTNILSQEAYIYKDRVEFNGSLRLINKEFVLNESNVLFNKQTKIISSKSKFKGKKDGGTFSGSEFVFDLQHKSLKAKNIKAILKEG